jgi:hypothetical protein
MRLLDHIAQSSAPLLVRQPSGALWRLTGAGDFAQELARCPLRYVLANELVRTCVALAYSQRDELSGCLDLLHLPAERLWIEWDETTRREELARALPECTMAGDPGSVRGGVLISADPRGRAGSLRTFWLTSAEPQQPLLSPLETLLDLQGAAASGAPQVLLEGGVIAVRDPCNAHLDSLLQCAGFRLDPSWQRYYRCVAHDPPTRAQVISRSLAAVAFDIPMLLTLFLLMAIRGLVQTPVRPARLNAKRARIGKQPLLEHIEVSATVFAASHEPYRPAGIPSTLRRGPRLHHVRGHIVRRYNAIHWRGAHWRGHMRLGCVRSRTVELHLARKATSAETESGARGSAD